MTVAEFSNEFDLLYNSITSNTAPSINEYEKSVFLTKAQEEIIKTHFTPKGNRYMEGIDDSPKRQTEFSQLISSAIYPNGAITEIKSGTSIDIRSKFFLMPADLMFILNETIILKEGSRNILTQVVPLSYEEYTRLMNKPYKEPLKHQSWRLLSNLNSQHQTEIIVKSGTQITKYLVRYIKKPEPIILVNLTNDYGLATIDGKNVMQSCKLDSSLHREILNRAVELAKVAYLGDINGIVELNNRVD